MRRRIKQFGSAVATGAFVVGPVPSGSLWVVYFARGTCVVGAGARCTLLLDDGADALITLAAVGSSAYGDRLDAQPLVMTEGQSLEFVSSSDVGGAESFDVLVSGEEYSGVVAP